METDQVILTFKPGKDGRIVAWDDKGKVHLLDMQYCKANGIEVKAYEDWRCMIFMEKEKCNIVQPITRVKTAKENEALGIGKLQQKYANGSKRKPGQLETSNRR
jgi:hypothetical protein